MVRAATMAALVAVAWWFPGCAPGRALVWLTSMHRLDASWDASSFCALVASLLWRFGKNPLTDLFRMEKDWRSHVPLSRVDFGFS